MAQQEGARRSGNTNAVISYTTGALASVGRKEDKLKKSEDTYKTYLSLMKKWTALLNKITDHRREALIFPDTGDEPLKYTGLAKHIYKLKMPMTLQTVEFVFTIITNDASLSKKGKKEKKRLRDEERTVSAAGAPTV